MNKNGNFQTHRKCNSNILQNPATLPIVTSATRYQDKICWLFQTVQNCIGFQETKDIRPYLYQAKCVLDWQEQRLQGIIENPETECSCLLITALTSILYKNDPSKKNKMNCSAHPNESFMLDLNHACNCLEFFENPFEILNRFGSQFDDKLLEATAELIVLALTNSEFRHLSPKMLVFGAINAINKYKDKKQEIQLVLSAEITTASQGQKSIQLFQGLLRYVQNM